jgi:hypothetical protein
MFAFGVKADIDFLHRTCPLMTFSELPPARTIQCASLSRYESLP